MASQRLGSFGGYEIYCRYDVQQFNFAELKGEFIVVLPTLCHF